MNAAHDVLWIGFEGIDDCQQPSHVHPGGVVLFAKNLDPDPVQGPARCHALVKTLRTKWSPLVVAMDQEGGPVSRLKSWVGTTPTLRQIWLRQGVDGCLRWGSLWGEGLARLGIQVDFAPVADLFDDRQDTGLGERRASEDPLEAARAAGAFLAGLASQGVQGCLKHFPGLGGTALDSHKGLPEIVDDAMFARNVLPFRMLAHPDRLVMVGHVRTPLSGALPASLHRGSVAGNPWGIRGRFIPDAMEMGGCAVMSWEQRVRMALEAGHEALLVCMPVSEVEACVEAVEGLPEGLWQSAAERFWSWRERLQAPQRDWDDEGWRVWVDRVRRAAAEAGVASQGEADPTLSRL